MSSVLVITKCYSGGALLTRVASDTFDEPGVKVSVSGTENVPHAPLLVQEPGGFCLWSHLGEPHSQKTVFISDLGDPRLPLRHAIPVSLDVWDGYVTAACFDLEEFEVADGEFEAIEELKASIVDLYLILKGDRDRLGPLPQRHWDYLRRVVQEG
jgi:hypothetical protein